MSEPRERLTDVALEWAERELRDHIEKRPGHAYVVGPTFYRSLLAEVRERRAFAQKARLQEKDYYCGIIEEKLAEIASLRALVSQQQTVVEAAGQTGCRTCERLLGEAPTLCRNRLHQALADLPRRTHGQGGMMDELLDLQVYRSIRWANLRTFGEISARCGPRKVDRALQRLRKRGVITYDHGEWTAIAPYEIAAAASPPATEKDDG